MILKDGLAILLVSLAGISDWKTCRIRNHLTIPFMGAGLLVNLLLDGPSGLLNSAVGLVLPFPLILLFAVKVLGAGDVKLFMAVGAVLGWRLCLWDLCCSALTGGGIALLTLALRRNGVRRLRHLYRYLWVSAASQRFAEYGTLEAGDDSYFSFGCCIAAGTLLVLGLDACGALTLF